MSIIAVRAIGFQSTLSVRRATVTSNMTAQTLIFQSTLSVRRATQTFGRHDTKNIISIHALREESDRRHLQGATSVDHFNPRSP